MSPIIHGSTQEERDRLVSLVFSTLEKRIYVTPEVLETFLASEPTPYTVIPEHVGFQRIDVHERDRNNVEEKKQYATMKGIYQSPLLYNPAQNLYYSTAQTGTTSTFALNLLSKRKKEDWIIHYDMHIWRIPTLQSTFMNEPISESLRAAALCRERFCPPHIMDEWRPIFVILVEEASIDEHLKRHIENVTSVETVILCE